MPDPMVKIFDVRTFKELTSISFEPGPAFVLPSVIHQGGLVVASAQGTFMTLDVDRAWEASFHQVRLSVSPLPRLPATVVLTSERSLLWSSHSWTCQASSRPPPSPRRVRISRSAMRTATTTSGVRPTSKRTRRA